MRKQINAVLEGKKDDINTPMRVKDLESLKTKCPNCRYAFKFAPRCPECGQIIDYGLSKSFYIK